MIRLLFGLLGALLLLSAAPAVSRTAASVDFRFLIAQHVDALNAGDVEGVLATFTEDGVVADVGVCAASPCVGKEAIRKEMDRRVNIKVNFRVFSLRENPGTGPGTGLGRAEIRATNITACGQERILADFEVHTEGDLISYFAVRFDRADAQTAAFLKCIATPVMPPSTGDGGLAN
ncbi:MAG TPA: hypothetical protein VFS30_05880 [Dehalococcoidia bacterium]|nr:hypothetical protein [Dehalococcoidia bacterium]